jgi:hypothetical protein
MRQAVYFISIDGQDISSTLEPLLISMTITLTDGGKSDTLEMDIDDSGGQLKMPREGAAVYATLAWSDGGQAVVFEGKTDQPRSSGTRGGGMIMSITAHAADMKDKPKEKKQKHKDDKKFGDVAKDFAKSANLEAKVSDKLASIERPYWDMRNESFMAWGVRMAGEMGATFKIMGKKAVFVPRNSNESASGQQLGVVDAVYGVNVIKWDLTPVENRPRYKQSIVRYYDLKEAKYKKAKVDIGDRDLDVNLTETHHATDKGQAEKKAESNAEESKRAKGGGTITIDGDPAAMAQAVMNVSGLRPGIDGRYRIATARHDLSRKTGWTVDCDLEQPDGDAGNDDRKADAKGGN